MDYYIGQIALFGTNYAIQNFAICDGSLLQISQWPEQFAILGTAYGGDGINTFALPKLTPPLPNMTYQICLLGVKPSAAA